MNSTPIAGFVNEAADRKFRLHILAADCPHVSATIHQETLSLGWRLKAIFQVIRGRISVRH